MMNVSHDLSSLWPLIFSSNVYLRYKPGSHASGTSDWLIRSMFHVWPDVVVISSDDPCGTVRGLLDWFGAAPLLLPHTHLPIIVGTLAQQVYLTTVNIHVVACTKR